MLGFVLLTIILRQLLDSSGPAPTHRDADPFAYFYVNSRPWEFLATSYWMQPVATVEPPEFDVVPRPFEFFVPARQNEFTVQPRGWESGA